MSLRASLTVFLYSFLHTVKMRNELTLLNTIGKTYLFDNDFFVHKQYF